MQRLAWQFFFFTGKFYVWIFALILNGNVLPSESPSIFYSTNNLIRFILVAGHHPPDVTFQVWDVVVYS